MTNGKILYLNLLSSTLNMKNFWIFLCIMTVLKLNVKAQQDTSYVYQIYPSFSNAEKAEWTAFQNNWNYFDYASLKQKYHIKGLNCKDCESFYAEVYMEIDEQGKVTLTECKRASRCGIKSTDKALWADFEASVKKQLFKSLKNKRFTVRLGNVLKC